MIATPRVTVATLHDLPQLGQLRQEQNWQRNEALLRSIITWPHGRIFVVREAGTYTPDDLYHHPAAAVVASVSAIAAGPVGVIGNVVVRSDHRRRGLARLLMNTAIAWMRSRAVRHVALDATADGRPLYSSLGFVEVTPSWFALAPVANIEHATLRQMADGLRARPVEAAELARMADLDRVAFGGDRLGLLERFAHEAHHWLYACDDVAGDPVGFLMVCPLEEPYVGIRIGPWVAKCDRAAAALLTEALDPTAAWRGWLGERSDIETEIFISPPGTNPKALALVRTAGGRVVQDDEIMRLDLVPPSKTAPTVMAHPEWQYAWLAPMVF